MQFLLPLDIPVTGGQGVEDVFQLCAVSKHHLILLDVQVTLGQVELAGYLDCHDLVFQVTLGYLGVFGQDVEGHECLGVVSDGRDVDLFSEGLGALVLLEEGDVALGHAVVLALVYLFFRIGHRIICL